MSVERRPTALLRRPSPDGRHGVLRGIAMIRIGRDMNVPFALVCASILVASALLVAGTLLFADGACPSLTVAGGSHWLKPYHAGENPWTDTWALQGPLPASRVAATAARPRATADHSVSTGTCALDGTDARGKSPS